MILEKATSKYNGEIVVKKALGLGVCISVDDLTQSGGILNAIWKRTLFRVIDQKLIVKNCLVLGLGGGTVATVLHKYWPKVKITGVDIDQEMIRLGKKYLNLRDINIKIGDAYKFVKENKKKYDLIIVDLYLGDECPEKFTSDNFINFTRSLLVRQGVVVFNRLYWGEKRKEAYKFGEKLEGYFTRVDYFYPQANLMLICHK